MEWNRIFEVAKICSILLLDDFDFEFLISYLFENVNTFYCMFSCLFYDLHCIYVFFLLYSTNGKFFATCMRTTTQIHLFIYLIFFPFFVLFFNFMFYRCWNINTMLCVYIQIKWKSHSDSTFMWRYEVCCFFIQNTNKKRHQTHIG